MVATVWHSDSGLWVNCEGQLSGGVASLVYVSSGQRDKMLQTFRPTPTCTRFQTSIQMPCMKCGTQMRLVMIEPRDQNYDVLTYRCTPCDSGESFLKAR
jgi:hypothetical protein